MNNSFEFVNDEIAYRVQFFNKHTKSWLPAVHYSFSTAQEAGEWVDDVTDCMKEDGENVVNFRIIEAR